MTIFKKFRRSTRVEKNKDANLSLAEPEAPFCHSCGQRTPQHSTFGSFSSRGTGDDFPSWKGGYQRSDSGYESLSATSTSSTSPTSAARTTGDVHSILSIKPPARQATYSSSVYSHDDYDTATEAFPPLPTMVEDDHDMFDLPPRTLSNYSDKFKPKSRYAKLNDLPAASPRALAFPDDLYDDDLDAGIEAEGDSHHNTARKNKPRRKWTGTKSLSVVILPSQLRRLSMGKRDT